LYDLSLEIIIPLFLIRLLNNAPEVSLSAILPHLHFHNNKVLLLLVNLCFLLLFGYLDVKIAFLLLFVAAFEHLQQGYAHCSAFVNIKARKILPKKVEIISATPIGLSDKSVKIFCQKRRK